MERTQVLVVGAGPTGLALAIELGGRGVACTVVERNDRVGHAPRAKTTHTRTREHMRRWGIAGDLLIMVPEQWLTYSLATELLTVIPVREPLPASPICMVTRTRLPLTPAAEHLTDLFRRASLHYVRARRERGARTEVG